MRFQKCLKWVLGAVLVGIITIYTVGNCSNKSNSHEESKNEFVRCSLQERTVAKGDGIIVTTLDGGYVFENTLEEGVYVNKKTYWSYLGLKGAGNLDAIFRYEDSLIYIASYIRIEDDNIYKAAIIQDIATKKYEIIKLVEEECWCASTGNVAWIIGDKLYYDFYYVPEGEDFWRYSVQTMDLNTYEKRYVCNYDELEIDYVEPGGDESSTDCEEYRVNYFVVREDGAIAFEVQDRGGVGKIFECKEGVVTKRVVGKYVYIMDYDGNGLFYTRPEDATGETIQDGVGNQCFIMQKDSGEEIVLLTEEEVSLWRKKRYGEIESREYKIFDERFMLIGYDSVQVYDFTGKLLREIETESWDKGEEYVTWEETRDRRFEYYEGDVWDMRWLWLEDKLSVRVTNLE